jgi:hypothetical protein
VLFAPILRSTTAAYSHRCLESGQLVLFADDINLLIIGKDEKELQYKVNEAMSTGSRKMIS